MLDFTFRSCSTPHHITETLSDITYYGYLARRTPLPILRRVIRSRFEPREYPSSMPQMYRWTPDECIPEFYMDESIFESQIPSLPSISLPEWCPTAPEFIKWHRKCLESDEVKNSFFKITKLQFL